MARILIVDDEPDIIDLMSNWLRLRGYEVLSAQGGEDAVRVVHSERPHLVLLDADMPSPDGIDTCRRLRGQAETRDLPVILIGGPDAAVGQLQALAAGATDMVTRPVNLDELGRRIGALLNGGLAVSERQIALAEDIARSAVLGLPCEAAWLLAVSTDNTAAILGIAASRPASSPPDMAFPITDADWLGGPLATQAADFNLPADDLPVASDPIYHSLREMPIGLVSVIPIRSAGGKRGLVVIGANAPLDTRTDGGRRRLTSVLLQARIALEVEQWGAPQPSPLTPGLRQPEPAAPTPITAIAFGGDALPDGEIDIASDLPIPTMAGYLDAPPADWPGTPVASETTVWLPAVIAALRDAVQAIDGDSLDETLHAILNETARSLNAGLALLALRASHDSMELVIQAAVGLRAKRLEGAVLPVAGTLAGRVVESGELQASDDGQPDGLAAMLESTLGLVLQGALAAPVVARGEIVGALVVANRKEGGFDEQDADTLRAMAGLVGLGIDRVRLNAESQRRIRELNLLHQTSAAASNRPARELAEVVARQFLDGLLVQWCSVALKGTNDDELSIVGQVADLHWPLEQARRLPLDGWPALRQVAATGQAVALTIYDDNIGDARRGDLTSLGIKSIWLAPLTIGDRLVGVAELGHIDADYVFSASAQNRCRQLIDAWHKTVSAGDDCLDAAHLRALASRLLEALGIHWCAIAAVLRSEHEAAIVYQAGHAAWEMGSGPRVALGEGSLRRAALAGRDATAVSLDGERLSPADRDALRHLGPGALLFAPLVAHGEVIGLVQLFDANPARAFSEGDRMIAGVIASLVAGALQNARLSAILGHRTEQIEMAYTQIREADRAKNQLIQNVSHELRTPLTAIIGYADMMLNEDFGLVTSQQREGLEIISDKTRQITRLIDEVLAVGQMHHEPLKQEMASIESVADLAVLALKPQLEQANITLETLYADPLPHVSIDRDRLFLVFENLISNAIKFSLPATKVTLTIWDNGQELQVEVTDRGIGIAPEEQDKIWQRFYQVDGSATRSYGGTGLGLALVRQVVEQHQGKVWVKSKPGEGSTFFFSIPKVETAGTDEHHP